jgi:hypothetical protein
MHIDPTTGQWVEDDEPQSGPSGIPNGNAAPTAPRQFVPPTPPAQAFPPPPPALPAQPSFPQLPAALQPPTGPPVVPPAQSAQGRYTERLAQPLEAMPGTPGGAPIPLWRKIAAGAVGGLGGAIAGMNASAPRPINNPAVAPEALAATTQGIRLGGYPQRIAQEMAQRQQLGQAATAEAAVDNPRFPNNSKV